MSKHIENFLNKYDNLIHVFLFCSIIWMLIAQQLVFNRINSIQEKVDVTRLEIKDTLKSVSEICK